MKPTKKERTQKEIIEAAKKIVHNQGHDAVTVRNLAQATGYSHTSLYYYFKDLNALLWSLRLEMIEDMIAELTSVPIQKEDPIEEILSAFFCYTDYFFDHPNVFRFFYCYPFVQPESDDRYQQLDQRFNHLWQTSFLRLTQEDILQPKDLELAAKTIIYSLQGMITLSFSSNGAMQREDIKSELERLARYLFSKSQSTSEEV